MSELTVRVKVEVFGLSPDCKEFKMEVGSEVIEFPASAGTIGNLAVETYGDLRFALFGGTGNPDNPWFEDQPEPSDNEVQK